MNNLFSLKLSYSIQNKININENENHYNNKQCFIMTLSLKRKLVAIVILPLAIAIVISSVTKYLDRVNTSDWKSVKGIVLFSGVQERTIYRKHRQSTFSPRSDMVYLQRIEYSYRVDGIDYTSKNFNLNPSSGGGLSVFDGTSRPFKNKDDAQKSASVYKIGTAVTVFYNPEKPKIASLSQKNASFFPIIFAIGFLGFAILLTLIAFDVIKPENLPWRKNS